MTREYTKEAFSKRLRSLLKLNGLSRANAAKRCGISPGALESYLYQSREPSAGHLAALSAGLKVPSDYLLFGTARAYG